MSNNMIFIVDVDNHKVPQEQPRQDPLHVIVEAPDEIEPKHRVLTFMFKFLKLLNLLRNIHIKTFNLECLMHILWHLLMLYIHFLILGHHMARMGSNTFKLLILVRRWSIMVWCILLRCFLNMVCLKSLLKLLHKLFNFLILKLICKVKLLIRIFMGKVRANVLISIC